MKQRVISAIVAAIIVIPLYIIGGIPFTIGIGLLAALALKEIISLKESHQKLSPFIVILAYILLELIVIINTKQSYIYNGLNLALIGITLLLLIIPTIFSKKEKYTTKDALYLIGSIILLGLTFHSIILLENASKPLLLYLFLIAAITDTFAMLIGSLIGKHKLIPSVSPKKTVEGSIAGSIMGTIIPAIFYYNMVTNNVNIILLTIITLVLSILGQLGDLFFSKIKRENDIKDFSNIMPGHGGILDRLDSFSFIILGYIIIINIIKYIA